jgi:hypothetical protein
VYLHDDSLAAKMHEQNLPFSCGGFYFLIGTKSTAKYQLTSLSLLSSKACTVADAILIRDHRRDITVL